MTTWNPSDKAAGATLTNGNLTVAGGWARATTGKTSGKWYWEVTAAGTLANDNVAWGFAKSTADIGGFIGSDANSCGFASYNGTSASFYVGGAPSFFTVATPSGSVFAIAADLDNGKIWLRTWNGSAWSNWNGSGTASPATNVGGFSFTPGGATWLPAISPSPGTETETANFGGSTLQSAPPSGFLAWDAASGAALTLSAAVGAFALTGVAAGQKVSFTSGAGAFALDGVAANPVYTPLGSTVYTLTAAAGDLALAGMAATLTYRPGATEFTAEAGSYALTGRPAALTLLRSMLPAATAIFTATQPRQAAGLSAASGNGVRAFAPVVTRPPTVISAGS